MTALLLVLWGGVVAVDNVSAVQSMISRPLAAGIVAGAILGDAALGAQVGALLELFLLVAVPAGGGRMPEGGTATLVAVAGASAAPGPGGLAVGIALGLIWGLVGGWSQTRLRNFNGRTVPVPGERPVTAEGVVRAQRLGITLDLVRGLVVTGVGAGLAWLAAPALAPLWPLGEEGAGLFLLGGLVSVGVLLRSERHRRSLVLFAVGVVLGLVAGVGV